MYHKRKRIFLWIIIGFGTASFISCGRGAVSDREGAGGGAAAEAASGAGETDEVEDGVAEGGTAKNGRAEGGTANAGTDRGAGNGTAETEADTASPEGLPGGADERPEQKGAGTGGKEGFASGEGAVPGEAPASGEGAVPGEAPASGEGSVPGKAPASGKESVPGETPQLPAKASNLAAFAPEGWALLDSVELDFNQDGIPDYVGVLEAAGIEGEEGWTYQDAPRILFAAAGDGAEGYRLDFQDINLIRTRAEGGVFGDPYEPLTAEGASFTTHAYGGSAWRWSEDYTYTYRGGAWYLTASETIYGYGSYITSYSRDDWDSGKGIRKERSSEFSDMEENWENWEGVEDWDSEKYDLEYELPLDEPLTLEQAGNRWWLAKDRVTDWEVASVTCAAGVELSEEQVERPGEAYLEYCDEDCALYSFSNGESGLSYLAMYRWEDRTLSVLAQEEDAINQPEVYEGKIYYVTDIVEPVRYKTAQDGEEQTAEEEDTVGVRLNRIALEGTGKETIFTYRYPEEGQEIRESQIPYLALIYEISGGDIIAEVYIGGKPHPFYRMKTDGSGAKKIGQVPMAVPSAQDERNETELGI
nr:hypothetical protein [uncultured Acetatifactor sp.]